MAVRNDAYRYWLVEALPPPPPQPLGNRCTAAIFVYATHKLATNSCMYRTAHTCRIEPTIDETNICRLLINASQQRCLYLYSYKNVYYHYYYQTGCWQETAAFFVLLLSLFSIYLRIVLCDCGIWMGPCMGALYISCLLYARIVSCRNLFTFWKRFFVVFSRISTGVCCVLCCVFHELFVAYDPDHIVGVYLAQLSSFTELDKIKWWILDLRTLWLDSLSERFNHLSITIIPFYSYDFHSAYWCGRLLIGKQLMRAHANKTLPYPTTRFCHWMFCVKYTKQRNIHFMFEEVSTPSANRETQMLLAHNKQCGSFKPLLKLSFTSMRETCRCMPRCTTHQNANIEIYIYFST